VYWPPLSASTAGNKGFDSSHLTTPILGSQFIILNCVSQALTHIWSGEILLALG